MNHCVLGAHYNFLCVSVGHALLKKHKLEHYILISGKAPYKCTPVSCKDQNPIDLQYRLQNDPCCAPIKSHPARRPSQSLCVKTDWIIKSPRRSSWTWSIGQVFEAALKATNILLQTPVLLTTLMQIVSPSLVCPHKYK